jgi:hypothetical protein
MYWAISGNPNEGIDQDLKYVIKDKDFYDEHVYDYFPGNFYSTNNSNPKFDDNFQELCFEKKILGAAIEKRCESMIALAPKMYTCFNGDNTIKLACKGYGREASLNPSGNYSGVSSNLKYTDYSKVYSERTTHTGTNNNFKLHNGVMS